MKSTIFIFLTIILFGCSRNENKDWRQNLLDYEKDGYKVILNGKQIKISRVFLDKREIEKTKIDNNRKVINLMHKKDKPLLLVSLIDLYSISNNNYRNDELFIIDDFVVERKNFESTELEMSAVKSVSVKKDTLVNGRRYYVYVFKTYNNER